MISRGTPTDLDAAWTTTTPPETDCVGSGDSHSFEIVDGIVYYSSIGSTALNAVDGALLSNPNLGGYEALPGQGYAGVLCAMPFPSDGYSSIVSDRDGAERFRVDEDAPASPWLVSASNSRPYIGSHGAYDMNDGTELWSVIGGDHFSLRRIIGDIVLGNDSDTLSAYRIDTGEQLWSTKIGDYFSYSVSDGERILVHPNDGRVLAVELDDGSVSWSLDSHTNTGLGRRPTTDSPRSPMTDSSTTHRPADRQEHRAGCPLSLNSTEATSTSRNADGHRP